MRTCAMRLSVDGLFLRSPSRVLGDDEPRPVWMSPGSSRTWFVPVQKLTVEARYKPKSISEYRIRKSAFRTKNID